MSDIDEARRMIGIAGRDLRTLKGMAADVDAFPDEAFGFFAQQAVEKALKAWLALAEGRYPRTHDLGDLFGRLQAAGRAVPERFLDLTDVVDFAVQYRYSVFEDEAGLDRDALCGLVADFIAHVEGLVKQGGGQQ